MRIVANSKTSILIFGLICSTMIVHYSCAQSNSRAFPKPEPPGTKADGLELTAEVLEKQNSCDPIKVRMRVRNTGEKSIWLNRYLGEDAFFAINIKDEKGKALEQTQYTKQSLPTITTATTSNNSSWLGTEELLPRRFKDYIINLNVIYDMTIPSEHTVSVSKIVSYNKTQAAENSRSTHLSAKDIVIEARDTCPAIEYQMNYDVELGDKRVDN